MRWRRRLAAAVLTAAILTAGALGVGGLRWKIQADWSVFAESAEYLPNEERGFYRIVGAQIADGAPVSDAALADFAADQDGMTLELLQLHIGAYANGPISEEGLAQMRRVLEAYRGRRARLIVRVLYDWDGVGMEADPVSQSVICTHMEQVGALLQEYADQIYIVQGVFVGSWAEMHGSRYLQPDSYRTLIQQMHRCMPSSVFLAVRTPAYWRMAAGTGQPLTAVPPENPTLAQRLSLFNDGMLGSDTDCGTYGSVPRQESDALTDAWTRSDELAFQNQLNRFVPNGGEVVLDNPFNDLENADRALRTMHVSYLNGTHDPAVLEKWKTSVWSRQGSVYDGLSGFAYIERHLGYRYVLRSARVQPAAWAWQTPELSLEIENVGYANRYTPCSVELLLKNRATGETVRLPVDTDVRTWESGAVTTLRVPLHLERGAVYELSLRVTSQSGAPVRFANRDLTGADGSCRLGTLQRTGGRTGG